MEWFLRARHWHIFLLVFLIPFMMIMAGVFLLKVYFNPALLFFLFPLSIAIGQIVLYLWMWNVVKMLTGKLLSYNIGGLFYFRLAIIIPLAITGLMLLFWIYGATLFSLGSYSMAGILYTSLFFILPLKLLVIISTFYCFLFVAKTLKTIEIQRLASFEDFFTEFILIALLPIGIWYLQPRINNLVNKNS